MKARYRHFGLYETAILGILSQSTGWATAARRIVEAAAPIPVIGFGARHVHPSVADVEQPWRGSGKYLAANVAVKIREAESIGVALFEIDGQKRRPAHAVGDRQAPARLPRIGGIERYLILRCVVGVRVRLVETHHVPRQEINDRSSEDSGENEQSLRPGIGVTV